MVDSFCGKALDDVISDVDSRCVSLWKLFSHDSPPCYFLQLVPPIKAGLRLRTMLGSRPQQDADPFYAVALLRKSSDRRYDRRAA